MENTRDQTLGRDNIGGFSLAGVSVCMLRASDYSIDARARKQAETLVSAGAEVVLLGVGDVVAADLQAAPYNVVLIPAPLCPRLGREDVWWPVRVAVNLTYTRLRDWWFRWSHKRSSMVYVYEPLLLEAANDLCPHIVLAHNILTLPAAVKIKQSTGAVIIYDCRDFYGEYIDARGRRKFSDAEHEHIGLIDATITVCEPLAGLLESRYGIARPEVIYNGPYEVMQGATEVHSPVRLFFQGKFTLGYNLASLVEAMVTLRGKATLSLQGFGGVEAELREQVARLGLEDVVFFVPPVGPLDVVTAASQYDVGVICYEGETLNLRSAVPNKLMDYLGAGLAAAASDLPGHRSVLEGTDAGIFIDPSSPATIARDIDRLLDDPERITRMKRAALETAKRYEWSVQAGNLIDVFVTALRDPGRTNG